MGNTQLDKHTINLYLAFFSISIDISFRRVKRSVNGGLGCKEKANGIQNQTHMLPCFQHEQVLKLYMWNFNRGILFHMKLKITSKIISNWDSLRFISSSATKSLILKIFLQSKGRATVAIFNINITRRFFFKFKRACKTFNPKN